VSHPLTEDIKNAVRDRVPTTQIRVGDYKLFDWEDDIVIGIMHPNGEAGLFHKKEFEAHVAAFFGLNFP